MQMQYRFPLLLPLSSLLLASLLPGTIGAQSENSETDSSTGSPSTKTVKSTAVTPEENIAIYSWPTGRGLIPLNARILAEVNDGIPESILYLTGEGVRYSFHVPNGLVVAEDSKGASCRLLSRTMPDNSLDFFLFEPGTFLPGVNVTTLKGYRKGLNQKFEETITFDTEPNLIPNKTFSIYGNRWGQLHYTLALPEGPRSFAEFFVPLSDNLLVLRLEGMESFVRSRAPQVVRMMSTLSIEN